MKKIVCKVLAMCFFLSMGKTVFATDINVKKVDNQVIYAKSAYFENVNATGTNLNTDLVDGDKYTKSDTKLKINIQDENTMVVTTRINGNDITFTAIPIGRSENSNVVYFEGESSDPQYSIVNFTYEENIGESSMYFTKYKNIDKSKSSTVLKIYLKKNNSRDYIILEAFDFKSSFDKLFINSLPEDSLLGAWTAREFEPIDSYMGEDNSVLMPRAIINDKY